VGVVVRQAEGEVVRAALFLLWAVGFLKVVFLKRNH
jgi:hypothetical protein